MDNIIISTGGSRTAKAWRSQEMSWGDLVTKLSNPIITKETIAEYKRMPKSEQANVKDVGGFVGGQIANGGRRVKGAVKRRYLLTLDADSPSNNLLDALNFEIGDLEYVVYSTHSHTPKAPRYRLILPTDRPMTCEEYQAVARRVAGDVGIEYFDPTTFEPERLMFWPSSPSDIVPVFIHNKGSVLAVDTVLKQYTDWHDTSLWPNSKRAETIRLHSIKKQGDPLTKPGLIGAFCRCYSIEDAISTFLSDVYDKCDVDDRYTYTKGSTSGGLVVYDEGRFAYSHHGTDPISGMLVNAFDLVRVHKFGDDEDSNKAMREFVRTDAAVQALIDAERISDFEDDGLVDEDYLKHLDHDKEMRIMSTAKNVKLILSNDPKLAGKIALNDFAHRLTTLGSLPWREEAGFWTDSDDASLRNYLSVVYGIVGRGIIDDALMEVSNKLKYHPVRDYLNAQIWDGECRVDTLLIDYVGAEDTPYIRAVTRKWLCGAVARVMEPGVKFDTTLVIYGPQGLGKTLVIERLGGAWFNNTIGDVKQKDAMEQIQGSWICELAELAPTYKNDNEVVKAFLSRTVDRFRAPYGKRTEEYPRQCVFAGTTNNLLFLKDKTGNRRFWPVEGKRDNQTKTPYTDLTPEEVGQIWAEAVYYYNAGEDLILPAEIESYAESVRQRHTEGFEKTGLIIEYLNTPIPTDWYKRDLSDMRMFIDGTEDVVNDNKAEIVQRDRVCALEIWMVVFGGSRQNLTNAHAREINDILQHLGDWVPHKNKLRFGKYFGVQQAYVHVSRSQSVLP